MSLMREFWMVIASRRSTVQAKTKIEPYSRAPGEISEVLQSWLKTDPSPTARFEFASDGSLGPGVVEDLRPALQRLGEGALSPEDRDYLTKKGRGTAPTQRSGASRSRAAYPRAGNSWKQGHASFSRRTWSGSARCGSRRLTRIFRLFGETVLGSGVADSSEQSRAESRANRRASRHSGRDDRCSCCMVGVEIEASYRVALEEIPL